MEVVNKLSESADVPTHNLGSVGELGYVSEEHKIHLRRGKWRRYSQEMEQRIIDSEKDKD